MKEILTYHTDTGIFYWKENSPSKRPGSKAGTLRVDGYIWIALNKKLHAAHRLAWLYVYEKYPVGDIDHINGVKSDNRISNLRDVTKGWNSQNQSKPHKDNKLGFLGVKKRCNRFVAQITVEGRTMHLGTYDTPEEAHEAYLEAKRKYHPGNTL